MTSDTPGGLAPGGPGTRTLSRRLRVHRWTVAQYIEEGVLKEAGNVGKGLCRIREGDLETMLVPEKTKSVMDEKLDAFIPK